MKKYFLILFFLAGLAGCTNPLGKSSQKDSEFSPGYQQQVDALSRLDVELSSLNPVASSHQNLKVRALDLDGNILSDYEGAIVISSSDVKALFSETAQFAKSDRGEITIPIVFKTAGSQNLKIVTTGRPVVIQQALDVSVQPGVLHHLAFGRNPGAGFAGVVLSPSILVRQLDADDNVVTSSGQAVTIALGQHPVGAVLGGTVSRSAVGGENNFNDLQISRAGVGLTLKASSAGVADIESSAFDVRTLLATDLAVVQQPSSGLSSAKISATIQLRDANGDDVLSSGITVTSALSGGPMGAMLDGVTSVVTDSNGQAQFNDLQIKKAGTGFALVFSSAGLTGISSTAFQVSPGPPSALASTITASKNFVFADGVDSTGLTITLKDSYGNPVQAGAVSLTSSSSGVSISQPAASTDANGETTARISASSAGTKIVAVSQPAGLGALSVIINALSTNLTQTWDFKASNSSSYVLSSSSLEFTSSLLRHRSLAVDNSNDSTYGFAAATESSHVDWSGANGVFLNSAGMSSGSGGITSRHFEAAANLSWTGLSFTSLVPSGKRYPDSQGVETEYSENNISMANNLILLHFDDANWTNGAYDVTDSSSRGHAGNIIGSVSISSDAKFGKSAFLNGGCIEIPADPELSGMSEMSFEAWIKPSLGSITGLATPLIGYRESAAATNYAFSIFAFTGGNLYVDLNSVGNRYNTSYVVQENVWQHIAVTYKGGTTKTLTVYVNGTSVYSTTVNPSSINSVSTTNAAFYVGRMKGNGTYFKGNIDELAFYNRTLTGPEILARYQRALTRMKFQVRACTSSCTTESFVGPDGTSATYFSEFHNSTLTKTTSLNLTGLTSSKDFQYKVILETDKDGLTPKLGSVSVTPTVYDIRSPNVISSGVTFYRLKGFQAVTGGSGGISYQLLVNDTAYYHNGTSWMVATNSLQTNTESEIDAAISSLHTMGTGILKIKAFFQSGTYGTSPATLSSVTVTGNQ